MKNTSLIVTVVLFVAVAGLYILHFAGGKAVGPDNGASKGEVAGFKIAYIKIDSLVVNYEYAIEMNETFNRQQDSYTKEYSDKRSRFESQAADYQEKLQRGGFLTQERAMQEHDRLMGEQQQIGKLDQELSSKLAQMQAENNKQLLDSVLNYLKIFNKDKKYNYIFNAADIMIGDESHNITREILTDLNARYNKARLK